MGHTQYLQLPLFIQQDVITSYSMDIRIVTQVHMIVDEIIMNGTILETSKKSKSDTWDERTNV